MFPPLPTWDGLHPLVVHFPIALFMVAPVFVILAILFGGRTQGFAWSAFLLLALGCGGALLALETGEAAGEFVTHGPAAEEVLEQHDTLAHRTAWVYGALTVLYGLNVLVLPLRVKRMQSRVFSVAANAVFLFLLLVSSALLANTADLGGRLVHKYGVHAILPGGDAVEDEFDF